MGFKLKSGNAPLFKNIGSTAPVKDVTREPAIEGNHNYAHLMHDEGKGPDPHEGKEGETDPSALTLKTDPPSKTEYLESLYGKLEKLTEEEIEANKKKEQKLTGDATFLTPSKPRKPAKPKRDLIKVPKLEVITPVINPEKDAKKKKEKDLNSNTPKNNTEKVKVKEKGMTKEEISKIPKGA